MRPRHAVERGFHELNEPRRVEKHVRVSARLEPLAAKGTTTCLGAWQHAPREIIGLTNLEGRGAQTRMGRVDYGASEVKGKWGGSGGSGRVGAVVKGGGGGIAW